VYVKFVEESGETQTIVMPTLWLHQMILDIEKKVKGSPPPSISIKK
jgi:hypothetical protein